MSLTLEEVENEMKLKLLKLLYIAKLREKAPGVENEPIGTQSDAVLDETIGKYTLFDRKAVVGDLFGVEFDDNGYPFIQTPDIRMMDEENSPVNLDRLDDALSPVRGGYDPDLQSAAEFGRSLNELFDAVKEKDESAADELERELASAWREKYDEDSRFDEPWTFELDNSEPEEDVVMEEPMGFDAEFPSSDEIADDSDVDIDVDPIEYSCSLGIKLRF